MKTMNALCTALFLLLFTRTALAVSEIYAESRVGNDNPGGLTIEMMTDLCFSPDYQLIVEDQDAMIIRKSAYEPGRQKYPSKKH